MPETTTSTDSESAPQPRSAAARAPAEPTPAPRPLKRTPLYDVHAALGAKLVPFAGFEMPVQYPTGITAEHKAVREKAGLFDVSHMGEFVVRGPQAVEFVNHVTTNDVTALKPGQAQYSTILREDGTIVDDCLVYRADDRVLMVVNGSNIDKDFSHISRFVKDFDVTLDDISDKVALLALQGPDAARILQQHTDTNLSADQVLRVHPRHRRRRRESLHLAHRLHRRRWIRALLPGRARREGMEGADRVR